MHDGRGVVALRVRLDNDLCHLAARTARQTREAIFFRGYKIEHEGCEAAEKRAYDENTFQHSECPIWPAPGFVDARLSYNRLPVEVHQAEIAEGRVAAGRIVEALDVIEHLGPGMIARVT